MRARLKAPLGRDHNVPTRLTQDELLARGQELLNVRLQLLVNRRYPSTCKTGLKVFILCVCALYFVLTRQKSFSDVHGSLGRGLWFLRRLRVSKQAYFHRFSTITADALLWIINITSARLLKKAESFGQKQQIKHMASFANAVYSLDDSKLEQIKRKYFQRQYQSPPNQSSPTSSAEQKTPAQEPPPTLDPYPGTLSVLFHHASGLLQKVAFYDNPLENEKAHAQAMVENLPLGSLLLFDLGYFSFFWFDWLTEHYTYFISRMRKGTSFKHKHTFVETADVRDYIIELGKFRSDRAKYPVRYVEIFVNGEWWGYITNMLDPYLLPAHHIYMLYEQRWTIERLFYVLKEVLGLNDLRLCHLEGVKWQIWATVLAYQIAQSVNLELSSRLKVEPEQISWEMFLRSIPQYYREARRSKCKSYLEWLVQNAETLRLVKPKRKSERKVQQLPAEIAAAYSVPLPPLPEGLEPRTPRYAQRKCGSVHNRQSKTKQHRCIIGMVKKQKKPRKPGRWATYN